MPGPIQKLAISILIFICDKKNMFVYTEHIKHEQADIDIVIYLDFLTQVYHVKLTLIPCEIEI